MSADLLSTFALIAAFIFFAYQGFKSSAADERSKAEQLLQRKNKEQDELAFINKARSLLPNGLSVLTALQAKYTWQQMHGGCGIGVLDMELLRDLPEQSIVTLPNPKSNHPNDDEIRLIRNAKVAANSVGEVFDIDVWSQEPSTLNLERLGSERLVKLNPITGQEDRVFSVAVTARGRLLIDLDEKLRDRSSRFEVPKHFLLTSEARSAFAELVKNAIDCAGDPAPHLPLVSPASPPPT